MEELAKLQILQKEKEKLEGENRRWEETQSEKLDAKSSNALEYYRRERVAAIKRHTNREEFCAGKITEYSEKLEEQTKYFNKKIKEYTDELKEIKQESKDYLESSDATITRLSTVNIIRPERIKRNDDRLNRIRLDIEMIELHQKNLQAVESPTHTFQYGALPEKTWEPTQTPQLIEMEEELKRLRATRVKDPEI
jgi:DNA repair ATPase RecN